MTMDARAKPEPIMSAANTASAAGGAQSAGAHLCAGCGKPIGDRFLLRALDLFWHEDCLKCGCCDCRLGEVGNTLYTKSNLMLCKRDYLRLFGNTGLCAACNKMIPAFEMVMRARSNVYHLECFACQQCNHRFCVGDRFYLCENKILCEYDYEERLVFASIGNHPMLKRHANSMSGPTGPAAQPGPSQSSVPSSAAFGSAKPPGAHPQATHGPMHGCGSPKQPHGHHSDDLNNNSNPNQNPGRNNPGGGGGTPFQ